MQTLRLNLTLTLADRTILERLWAWKFSIFLTFLLEKHYMNLADVTKAR